MKRALGKQSLWPYAFAGRGWAKGRRKSETILTMSESNYGKEGRVANQMASHDREKREKGTANHLAFLMGSETRNRKEELGVPTKVNKGIRPWIGERGKGEKQWRGVDRRSLGKDGEIKGVLYEHSSPRPRVRLLQAGRSEKG